MVAATITQAVEKRNVSIAKPIPITPNCAAEVAKVCGIQITDQTATPLMPTAVRIALGSRRNQVTRRPSSR